MEYTFGKSKACETLEKLLFTEANTKVRKKVTVLFSDFSGCLNYVSTAKHDDRQTLPSIEQTDHLRRALITIIRKEYLNRIQMWKDRDFYSFLVNVMTATCRIHMSHTNNETVYKTTKLRKRS
jgi:hypothetical protein